MTMDSGHSHCFVVFIHHKNKGGNHTLNLVTPAHRLPYNGCFAPKSSLAAQAGLHLYVSRSTNTKHKSGQIIISDGKMRKYSFRQTANRYLNTDNRGSFKDKKTRAFVIHKMIDDLYIIGKVPPYWQALETAQIQQLVHHWQKKHRHPVTIMRYMTIIRRYLDDIGCSLAGIDNQGLGINRQSVSPKKRGISSEIWQQLSDLPVRLTMALQTEFGLTFAEAIYLRPDIHVKENRLWITREIAFNSQDRDIPLRFEQQASILAHLKRFIGVEHSLAKKVGYETICQQWRMALSKHHLPCNKTYRYLYAQMLYQALSPTLGSYQTRWLILDEMGIKSRNTLWLYLNE